MNNLSRAVSKSFLALLFSLGTLVSVNAAENPWFLKAGYALSEIDSPLALKASTFSWDPLILLAPGPSFIHSDFERDDSVTLSAGRWFGDRWGLEVSYLEFGDFSSQRVALNESERFLEAASTIKVDGFNISLFGEIPLTPQWAIRGKIGVFAYDSDSGFESRESRIGMLPDVRGVVPANPSSTFGTGNIDPRYLRPINLQPSGVSSNSPFFNPFFNSGGNDGYLESLQDRQPVNGASDKNGEKAALTLGVVYKINNNYSLELDYTQLNHINGADIEFLNLGLSYRF